MEISTNKAHGGLVTPTVRGCGTNSTPVTDCIVQSWKRCLDEYDLDPERHPEPVLVDRSDLKERQEKSCRLVEIARSEMTNLYQQVAGSGEQCTKALNGCW